MRAPRVSVSGLARRALRLASLVDALVVPCIITAGRGGAVKIALADAVDPDAVRDRRRHRAICEQLFRDFLPSLQASPGQCEPWLLGRLRSRAQTAEASLEGALEP